MQGDSPCLLLRRVGRWRAYDGVDEVRRAVRQELQMGADQIKIMASGACGLAYRSGRRLGLFRGRDPRHRRRGARADPCKLAHAYTAEAISRAVRCGVRTIEHGNLVDAEAARLDGRAGRRGAHADHPRGPGQRGSGPGLPADSVAKVAQVRNAGLHSLEIYRDAGVPMGFGTDLLGPSHRLQSGNSACAPRCWARRR